MADVQLKSFIGWVDLSDGDLKHAREYLRSLSEGTLDELGFGSIRDSFADRFFPGTSTVLSYAKYFVLVPAIYICVLESETRGRRARKRCDDLEQELRDHFRDTEQIGGRQKKIKNMPAADYWPSLRRLGIYQAGGSLNQYFENLQDYLDMRKSSQDDDDNSHVGQVIELWDPELRRLYNAKKIQIPDFESGFPDDTEITLNLDEAKYLRRKFIDQSHDPFPSKDSIIAHALQRPPCDPGAYPWQWPIPQTLKNQVHHAERYSMFTKIATLLYYELIIKKRAELKFEEANDKVVNAIQKWWDTARSDLIDWNLDDFLELVEARQCTPDDSRFMRDLLTEIKTANSANAFIQSPKAKKLITQRESDKRPQKRRLAGGRFLKDWQLTSNGTSRFFTDTYQVQYLFDYRAGIASRIVGEIFERLSN